MPINPDAAISRGDLLRRLHDLEQQVKSLQTARRGEAMSIGRGGVTVRGGGIVILDETGAEMMRLSTDGLTQRGSLDVLEGGNIIAHHPDNSDGVILGLFRVGDALGPPNRGISVQTDDSVPPSGIFENANIFAAYQRTTDNFRAVQVGELGNFIEEYICRADLIVDGCGEWQVEASDDAFITALNQVTIRAGGASGLILGLEPPGSGIGILIQPGGLFIQVTDTTASAANVNFDGFGRVRVVTSAARNKLDVEDLAVDVGQVLRLRPRTWRDRAEVANDPDTDRWHVGLVAEEVDAAGLHEFVDYDTDGNPEAVTYDRLVVALLEVVRQQQARLDALDGGAEQRPTTGRKPRRRRSDLAQPPPASPSARPARQ